MPDEFHLLNPRLPSGCSGPRTSLSFQDGSANGILQTAGRDLIDQLPLEILDRILSLLSPPTLDAARYVSRTWRDHIMSSVWILSQVLGSMISEPSTESDKSKDIILRQYGKQLDMEHYKTDCDHQAETWFPDDTWRIRYRKCNITFSTLNRSRESWMGFVHKDLSYEEVFTHASFSPSTSLLIFFVRDTTAITSQWSPISFKYTLLLYRISITGLPIVVASVACPEGVGIPLKVRIREPPEAKARTLVAEVTFSSFPQSEHILPDGLTLSSERIRPSEDHLKPFLTIATLMISERQGFGKYGSPYLASDEFKIEDMMPSERTKLLNEMEGAARYVKCVPAQSGESQDLPTIDPCWQLLEILPIVGSSEESRNSYYLGRHCASGKLFVVRIDDTNADKDWEHVEFPSKFASDQYRSYQPVTPMVLLSAPCGGSSFRNLAISARPFKVRFWGESILRLAIIWQVGGREVPQSSVLYVYDVVFMQEQEFTRFEGEETLAGAWPPSWRVDLSGQYLGPPLIDRTSTNIHEHYRRPVPKSPVYGRRLCSLDPGIGGLHWSYPGLSKMGLNRSPEDMGTVLEGISLTGEGEEQCLVWGPSPASDPTHIILQHFDLTYSQQRMMSLRGGFVNRCSLHLEQVCACAFHDCGYRILVPRIVEQDISPPARGSTWFPPVPPQRIGVDDTIDAKIFQDGRIEQCHSPAQAKALERVDRQLVERAQEADRNKSGRRTSGLESVLHSLRPSRKK
ncbi:MAG: hypothetical protein M1827_002301 [Pycnora praestabilis]|nr:MAG: hypothetical protein M1827_002301 [Pycnora praestabilis]